MELPRGIIADTLNQRGRKYVRGEHHEERPLLHVSSLIRSDPANFFCPREVVLRYVERREAAGAGLPPKFALLYAVGHFYGEYIVTEFLNRCGEWAQYAWGDWSCKEGCTILHRQTKAEVDGRTCDVCGGKIVRYLETDLFNPLRTVVGHADLIFNCDEHYYIYEFKSIDRADVGFETMNSPLADHVVQASNYYYMLKDEGKRVARNIRFVYVDRSMTGLYTQLPFKEFTAPAITRRRLANFYRRAAAVHESLDTGVLPPRLCEDITETRATQCSCPVSCFSRTRDKITRIP